MSEPKGILIVPVGFNPDDDVRAITVDADDYLNVVLNAGLTGGGMGEPKGKLATVVGFNPDGDVRALELDANDNLIVTLLVDAGSDEDDILTNKSGEASWEAPVVSSFTEACRVYNSVNIATVSGTNKLLTFDREDFDTDTMHDLVTNPGRITFKTAGKYIVILGVSWSANATNRRIAWIKKNGANAVARTGSDSPGNSTYEMNVVTPLDVEINDYVEAWVYQNSGAAVVIAAQAAYSPYFSAHRTS